jgi:hypothetical protein
MPSSKPRKRYSLKTGKEGTTFFVARASTGVVAGVPGGKHPSRPHLTVAEIKGSIDRHITFEDGSPRISIGSMSLDDMRRVVGILGPKVKRHSPKLAVWVPTPALFDSVPTGEPSEATKPQKGPYTGLSPLISPKLEDRTLWMKTTLREASSMSFPFAIRRVRGRIVWMIVFGETKTFDSPPEEILSEGSDLAMILGLERLLELMPKASDSLD